MYNCTLQFYHQYQGKLLVLGWSDQNFTCRKKRMPLYASHTKWVSNVLVSDTLSFHQCKVLVVDEHSLSVYFHYFLSLFFFILSFSKDFNYIFILSLILFNLYAKRDVKITEYRLKMYSRKEPSKRLKVDRKIFCYIYESKILFEI